MNFVVTKVPIESGQIPMHAGDDVDTHIQLSHDCKGETTTTRMLRAAAKLILRLA